ncbi:MAG: DUF309 domain-containing protein [Deltaproteobacteria bacterium]|nr:DUF309 domain-containing protein [Deltaproteobacteria bacterium]MBI3389501.1 DUF309 domain-containing protein [Deltaproteobacteria bacterium]
MSDDGSDRSVRSVGSVIPDPGPRARYTARPFPAYRYVPGVHPHPTRDPRGHSYEPNPTLHRHAAWQPEQWRTLEAWLFGVDLFNAHYFWEAHEAWEGLWAAMPRDSEPALLLQGLIQIAAALLKVHIGTLAGVQILSVEGLDKLAHVAEQTPRMLGLDLQDVMASLRAYFAPADRGVLPELNAAPLIRLAESSLER